MQKKMNSQIEEGSFRGTVCFCMLLLTVAIVLSLSLFHFFYMDSLNKTNPVVLPRRQKHAHISF